MPLETVNLAKDDKKEPFKATPEELQAIEEKMKDPKFVELMREYMESLSDPETRREEEAYLEQAEREAREGGDFSFEFIFPRPAFAVELLKPTTRRIAAAEARQVAGPSAAAVKDARTFVNFCTSDKVGEYREETTNDRMGSHWHVPVSVSQKRVEHYQPLGPDGAPAPFPATATATATAASEAEGEGLCYVCDAVFHPLTLALSQRSDRFLCFMVEIAVEHFNGGYKETHGFEFSRLPSSVASVGRPQNQTIRKQNGQSPFAADTTAPVLTAPQKPTPTSTSTSTIGKVEKTAAAVAQPAGKETAEKEELPPHTIAHRGRIDMTDAWQWKVSDRRVGVPEELVVRLTFGPGIKAAALDVSITPEGEALRLERTAEQPRYAGLLALPFCVESEPVSAKFERGSGVLTLTLRVLPPLLSSEQQQLRDELMERAHTGSSANTNTNTNKSDTAVSDPTAPVEKQEEKKEEVEEKKVELEPMPPTAEETPTPTPTPTPTTTATAAPATEAPAATPEPSQPAADKFVAPPPPSLSELTQQSDRAREMMEKVAAARKAREATALQLQREEEEQEANTKGESARAEPSATTAAAAVAETASEVHAAATTDAAAPPVSAEAAAAEIPFLKKRDPQAEEAAALQARQEAWLRSMEAQSAALAAAEDDEEARLAAHNAKREREKAERQKERAKEAERLRVLVEEKMAAVPLSNKHIFAID